MKKRLPPNNSSLLYSQFYILFEGVMTKVTVRVSSAIALLFILLATGSVVSAQTQPADAASAGAALQKLEREIERLARSSGGTVGMTAIHLETGRRVSLNRAERFPMASTFKVPIAVQLLTRVDQGEIKLDQMVELNASDLHPGSGTLSELFNKPGVALSVRNLLELMLLVSDNSATDVVLRLAGGPQAVTARMKALSIEGITVDRSTALLIADWVGVAKLPPEKDWTPAVLLMAFEAVKPEEQREAAKRFNADPRDTSTPDGMAALLERIYRKELLKPQSAELLLDIMRRCKTGAARLKGILPEGTEVAHKTGTIGGTTNDVGIITLPEGAGHVAIAVFVKASEKDVPARERTIAEIARAVHDFFLFH
jgi:beta-lactamase class A